MFLPSVHAEPDTEVLLQFIWENQLGILITGLSFSQQDFLQCTHVPFVLELPEQPGKAEPCLRAHIAKQRLLPPNPKTELWSPTRMMGQKFVVLDGSCHIPIKSATVPQYGATLSPLRPYTLSRSHRTGGHWLRA
jgi:predicted FMN-binding regulatory protein PaiB